MKKLSQQEFEQKAFQVHGNKYTYGKYEGAGVPISIYCRVHGEFKQTPNAHITQAQNCPKCVQEFGTPGRLFSQDEIVQKAIKAHGGRYDYSQVNYVKLILPVKIICPDHGVFYQAMHQHVNKKAKCPECAKKFQQKRNVVRQEQSKETFILRAMEVHGALFDYSGSFYEHNSKPVAIRCITHDKVFLQKPKEHLVGHNPCPQCNHMKSSQEEAIAKYLSLFTSVTPRDRTVLKPQELDIYLPEKSLAVEYCGMYWHSHGNAEEEKKNKYKHYNKYVACAQQGIRLLTIYESEWLERPAAIKRLLRNAVGAGKGKLMARKCDLRKVGHSDAVEFFEKYHPQGGNGSGDNYGLFHKGKLVACMRFTFGINDRGSAAQKASWTLSRYATRITVAGGASRLFKAFVTEHSPESVKSFSDNRYFSGGMYEQLGFVLEEEAKPDYQVWSPKIGLRAKPHYQRRNLQKRFDEHGFKTEFNPENDTRTESECTYEMGARRIYDCGKKRWVWKKPIDPSTT